MGLWNKQLLRLTAGSNQGRGLCRDVSWGVLRMLCSLRHPTLSNQGPDHVFIATGSRGRWFFLSMTRRVLCILTTQRAWCSCQRHLESWNCEWQAARWRLMKWKALQTTREIYRAHMKCCVKTGLVGRTAPCDSSVASIESIVSVDVCAVERSRRISATLFTSRRLRDAHQNIPKFNGLVSRKIYRKAPYLMGKSVVSCRFSL